MAKNYDTGLDLKELRKFGYSFSIGMAILTIVGLLKSFPLSIIIISLSLSIFHLLGSIVNSLVLNFTHKIITIIGRVISTIITTIFFTAFYYIIFTPFSLFCRLIGKDVIGQQLKHKGWIDISVEENNPERIEKLY